MYLLDQSLSFSIPRYLCLSISIILYLLISIYFSCSIYKSLSMFIYVYPCKPELRPVSVSTLGTFYFDCTRRRKHSSAHSCAKLGMFNGRCLRHLASNMLNDKVVDWVSMNLSHVATASAFDLFLSQQAGSTIPYKLG